VAAATPSGSSPSRHTDYIRLSSNYLLPLGLTVSLSLFACLSAKPACRIRTVSAPSATIGLISYLATPIWYVCSLHCFSYALFILYCFLVRPCLETGIITGDVLADECRVIACPSRPDRDRCAVRRSLDRQETAGKRGKVGQAEVCARYHSYASASVRLLGRTEALSRRRPALRRGSMARLPALPPTAFSLFPPSLPSSRRPRFRLLSKDARNGHPNSFQTV
jgi:hypothetical protein